MNQVSRSDHYIVLPSSNSNGRPLYFVSFGAIQLYTIRGNVDLAFDNYVPNNFLSFSFIVLLCSYILRHILIGRLSVVYTSQLKRC